MCKTTGNAAISETQCKHLDEIIKTVWLLLSENVLKAELASFDEFCEAPEGCTSGMAVIIIRQ